MEFKTLYDSLVSKLEGWAEGIAAMLPNFIVAVLIVAVAWGLSKLAYKLSDRALSRFKTNKAARSLLTTFVRFAVLAVGIVVALGVLNLDKALTSILAGAGVVGLALGFAFQDIAANMISGIGLAFNKELPFKIGDVVDTNDTLGTVEKIQLRSSLIRTFDGKRVVIPNAQVFQNKVTNYSVNGQLRVAVECGVSYGDDLEKVKAVAIKAIEGVPSRDTSRDVKLYFKAFGGSSVDFEARFWVKYDAHSDFMQAKSEAICSLKKAFDENDIMIPFPIRTMDFGIRGGERLDEMLSSSNLRTTDEGRRLNGEGTPKQETKSSKANTN